MANTTHTCVKPGQPVRQPSLGRKHYPHTCKSQSKSMDSCQAPGLQSYFTCDATYCCRALPTILLAALCALLARIKQHIWVCARLLALPPHPPMHSMSLWPRSSRQCHCD